MVSKFIVCLVEIQTFCFSPIVNVFFVLLLYRHVTSSKILQSLTAKTCTKFLNKSIDIITRAVLELLSKSD